MLKRGVKLQIAGERSAAERLYRQVLEADPHRADALHLLGLVEYENGNFQRSIDLIQQAISIDSGRASFYMDLGTAFRALGQLRQAAESYIQSLRLNPRCAEAYVNLGNAFKDGQQFDDALGCYRQAIALKPGLIGAHQNLGNALRLMGRHEEALAAYRKAFDLDPGRAATHYNLASLMNDLGALDEALDHCRKALELGIDSPDQVLFLQGLIELVRGDLAVGWEHYERRWGSPDHDTPRRTYAQPQWTGGKLPHGNLFVWGEQGIGDEIMFAGLLPDVLRTGNRCILECDRRLQPLFGRSFPGILVVGQRTKDARHCRAHSQRKPSPALPFLPFGISGDGSSLSRPRRCTAANSSCSL